MSMSLTKKIIQAFGGVSGYYDEYMKKTVHVEAQRKMAQFIAENKGAGLILDVATGTGVMLEPFGEGVGVDVSKEMLNQAKDKSGKEFLVADVHHLPFRRNAFSTAMSCLAFLWFDDPERALSEMLRVAERLYIVEEEGTPARKRVEIPTRLKQFFHTIEKLEKEVHIEELDAYRSSLIYGRVFEADIDGSHKFVCWMATGRGDAFGEAFDLLKYDKGRRSHRD